MRRRALHHGAISEGGAIIEPSASFEQARKTWLAAARILDTPREESFDRLVFMAAQILRAPMASIGFMDDERLWLKSWVGVPEQELIRHRTICALTRQDAAITVIPDARTDPLVANNPYVIGRPFVRFYIKVPLSMGGYPIGHLCAADTQPKQITDAQRAALVSLGRAAELLLQERLAMA